MKLISSSTLSKIFGNTSANNSGVNLTFDSFLGDPIAIANAHSQAWVDRHNKILSIPDRPITPSFEELAVGWNKLENGQWLPSDPPTGTIIFDTETHGQHYQFPIIGVAVSVSNWYIWLSNWAKGDYFKGELIELDNDSLVIAHNASFDIGRVANSYRETSPDWLDTQSMVQAVNGLTRKTINIFSKARYKPSWFHYGCGVSLKDAVTYWCSDIPGVTITQEDKNLRLFFADCDTSAKCQHGFIENFDSLMNYAINDVFTLFHLFRKLIKEFSIVCPNLTSLYAISLMLRAKFPVNPEFNDWIKHCDFEFESKLNRVNEMLAEVARNTVNNGDHWAVNLDWDTLKSGKDKGKVKWRRAFENGDITMRSRVLPYLLKLQWHDYPLSYSKEDGWHYRNEDNEIIRLPHKNGEEFKVGNPLSDVYKPYIADGTLSSAIPNFDLREFHSLYFETTYWYGNRARIKELFVKGSTHIPSIVPHRTVTRRSGDRIWLTVPDLKEGKIGTAIKSQIRVSDPDHWLVGADFSTQEMNIAALLSDWYTSQTIGSNDFSQAVFEGDKELGTDPHSLLAKTFKIPRSSCAKPMNFAGLYNCGAKRYATILKQGTKDVSNPDELAVEILKSKRGEKSSALEPDWVTMVGLIKTCNRHLFELACNRIRSLGSLPKINLGGTDSLYYNSIDARLSASKPTTALLNCRMPRWLEKANELGAEWMTCANWNIQSTGVDILCLFLVLVDYLKQQRSLNFSYVVARHDEVWFKCTTSEIDQLADVMQLAHLSVWYSLAKNLGINQLPVSLALFPEINVDKVLRKEVDLDVYDGFGIKPENGYYIKADKWIAKCA
jgi:DNA polymerase gamma 1